MLTPDLLRRRASQFVLWRPARVDRPPRLIIGTFQDGDPPALAGRRELELAPETGAGDLWVLGADAAGLADGVYHYWFEVESSNPYYDSRRVYATDPAAWTADWRLLAPPDVSPPGTMVPAAVVASRDGALWPCDPDGRLAVPPDESAIARRPPNNRMVIYELPTQWTRAVDDNGVSVAAGTFEDVLSLVDASVASPNFGHIATLGAGTSYLAELGVGALELLPIEDSVLVRGWKYGSTNYFAPDHTLGRADAAVEPTPNHDLARLISACHAADMRFFLDVVMGFGRQDAYGEVNFGDFHVRWSDDPHDRDPEQDDRRGWGGDLWKYNYETSGYDPVDGDEDVTLYPARRLMQAFIAHWIVDQHIDGIRMDSVETIYNWDFVEQFRRHARDLFLQRATNLGTSSADADARFLVAAEYLAMPTGLLRRRVDAMWNEEFRYALRAALVGRPRDGDPDFEATVRKMIDCRGRIADFADTAEAINYVTSHDVANYQGQRLYDYLTGAPWFVLDAERRIKLAFSCLMTAVGIPMIFAGEEFADQHDLPISTSKETDPVNFARRDADPWRRRVFDHVARLVRLRQEAPALAVNDTEFIHIDQAPGRRVFAWRRGAPGQDPVVVVANFSDWQTESPAAPDSEYVVHGWPTTPRGREWREVTQARIVPDAWVGREPLYAWEAKVYILV